MVKLCLGTANVGSKYGIKKFKLSKNKVSNILKIALSEKIHNIDSSFEYKNSHKELSKIINNNFKVNTKTFLKKKNSFSSVKKKILYFNKHSHNKIYSLLLHDQNDALVKQKVRLLKKLKMEGFVNKIGVSVYDLAVLKKILKIWIPDIIQIPVNPFNCEFISNKFLKKLKRKKIIIFARSVFLQGILTNKKNILKNRSKKELEDWFKYCKLKSIDPVKACLDFCKSNKEIDYLVIGVQNVIEFKQIIKFFKQPIKLNLNTIIKKKYSQIDLRKI
tara:strand:+ start:15376 stop:16200 length:825 start_codon:yes stop_codon:yes gene_type:complete